MTFAALEWISASIEANLVQAGAAEAFQIALPVGFPHDRHLAGNPRQRDIWLHAAKLL